MQHLNKGPLDGLISILPIEKDCIRPCHNFIYINSLCAFHEFRFAPVSNSSTYTCTHVTMLGDGFVSCYMYIDGLNHKKKGEPGFVMVYVEINN